MRYVFKFPWRMFKPGDEVPATYGSGLTGTLMAIGKVIAVDDTEEKQLTAPSADKMMRRKKILDKAVA